MATLHQTPLRLMDLWPTTVTIHLIRLAAAGWLDRGGMGIGKSEK